MKTDNRLVLAGQLAAELLALRDAITRVTTLADKMAAAGAPIPVQVQMKKFIDELDSCVPLEANIEAILQGGTDA